MFSSVPVQEYRRFQVNFQSAEAASQLVDAIALVCPCKSGGINEQARSLRTNQSLYTPDSMFGRSNYPESSQSSQTLQTPLRHPGRQMTMAIPATPIHHRIPNAHISDSVFRSPLTPSSGSISLTTRQQSTQRATNKNGIKNQMLLLNGLLSRLAAVSAA